MKKPKVNVGTETVVVGTGDLLALCSERKLMKDGTLEIHCKLGLWSVCGRDNAAIEREAWHYFGQYYRDGEYAGVLANAEVCHGAPEPKLKT